MDLGRIRTAVCRAAGRRNPRSVVAVQNAPMRRRAGGGSTGRLRAWAMLALLALCVRVVTPPGFMISASQAMAGGLTVTLCGGFGMHEAMIDLVTGEIVASGAPVEHKPESGATDSPCVFAAVAALARVLVPAIAAPVARGARVAQRRIVAASPGRGLAAPPPWPTGPPRSA